MMHDGATDLTLVRKDMVMLAIIMSFALSPARFEINKLIGIAEHTSRSPLK